MEIGKNWIDLSWGGMTVNEKIARLENNVEYLKGIIPDGLKDILTDLESKIETIRLEIEAIKSDIETTNIKIDKNNDDINSKIGNMAMLNTSDRTTLVGSINEVITMISNGGEIVEVEKTDNVLWIDIELASGALIRLYKETSITYKSIADTEPTNAADKVSINLLQYVYNMNSEKLEEIINEIDWIISTSTIDSIMGDISNVAFNTIHYYGYKKS